MSLFTGAVRCIVGCLSASQSWMQAVPQLRQPKMSPGFAKYAFLGKIVSVENHRIGDILGLGEVALFKEKEDEQPAAGMT